MEFLNVFVIVAEPHIKSLVDFYSELWKTPGPICVFFLRHDDPWVIEHYGGPLYPYLKLISPTFKDGKLSFIDIGVR